MDFGLERFSFHFPLFSTIFFSLPCFPLVSLVFNCFYILRFSLDSCDSNVKATHTACRHSSGMLLFSPGVEVLSSLETECDIFLGGAMLLLKG